MEELLSSEYKDIPVFALKNAAKLEISPTTAKAIMTSDTTWNCLSIGTLFVNP